MDDAVSLRLPEGDLKIVNQFSKTYKKDKSTSIRELLEMGRIYFAITEYIKGKISLGKASKIAGLPISDLMDLLADLGIKSKIELIDYIESKKTAKNLF